MANKITFDVGYNINKAQLNELKFELQQIQQLSVKEFMSMNSLKNLNQASSQLSQLKESANELQIALGRAFNTELGTVNIARLRSELNSLDIKRIYQDFQTAGAAGVLAFNQISSAALKTNLQLRESHNVLDKIAKTFGNTVKWNLTSSAVNRITDSIQSAWNYTVKLDKSLNDIRIVTGKSAEEMNKFADTANKAATKLGASTRDYTEAALIYYQQGLGEEDVQARTETTLKTANVTGQSTATVSEQLTAVWNGYKVSAAEAESYIDKLAAVAAATAADLEELSTGMSKVASAANLMGVDIDQLNAQLATIVSVTRQAPESVGTALKTIYARMGDIESGLDDETTLGEYTSQMEAMGIKVLDNNGKLRDMGAVIEEIGEKWQNLSREQQVALSQTMAGTRQYNNLLALFDNWDMYTDSLTTSQNALGTLQEQQDIYMDSTEAHLQKLSTSWERVFQGMVNSKSTNDVIDIFTFLTDGVANFVEAIGGGGNVLTAFGALVTNIFSKQITASINTAVNNWHMAENNLATLREQLATLRDLSQQAPGDKATQTRYIASEQMSKYVGNLNKEQIEEYNKLIDDYGNAIARLEAYNKKREEAENFVSRNLQYDKRFNINENTQSVLTENSDETISFERYSTGVEKTEQNLKLLIEQIQNVAVSYQDFTDLVKENLTTQERASIQNIEDLKKLGQAGEEVLDFYELYISKLDDVKKVTSQLVNEQSGLSEAQKKMLKGLTKDWMTIDKNTISYINNTKGAARKTVNVFDSIENKVKKVNDVFNQEKDNTNEFLAQEEKNAHKTQQAYEGAAESKKKLWEQANQQGLQLVNIENITQAASIAMSISSTFMTIKNFGNIWSNEDISLGEKLLQTTMGISTIILQNGPMIGKIIAANRAQRALSNAEVVKELGIEGKLSAEKVIEAIATKHLDDAKKEGVITNEATIGTLSAEQKAHIANTFATEAEAGALGLAKKAQDAFNASVLANPYVWIALAVVAAVALVVTAVNAATKEQDKYNQALKDAKQNAEEMTNAYKEAKSAYDDLKSSIEDYKEAQDALSKLTKGTDEWKESVIELNEQVLELIEKYPALAQYVSQGNNGALQISQEGFDKVLEQQQNKAFNANIQSLAAQKNVQQASKTATIDNFRSSNNFLKEQYGQVYKVNGQTISQGIGSSSALREGLNDALSSILQKINENGDGFLRGELDEEIINMGTELGFTQKQMTDALEKNRNSLYTLSQNMNSYDLAMNGYTKSIVSAIGNQHESYVDSNVQVLANNKSAENYEKYYKSNEEIFSGFNKEKLASEYASYLVKAGIIQEGDQYSWKRGTGEVTYTDSNGDKQTINRDKMIEQLSTYWAEQSVDSQMDTVVRSIEKGIEVLNLDAFDNSLSANSTRLGDFINELMSGQDVLTNYNKEQLQEYEQAWHNFMENADENLKAAVEYLVGDLSEIDEAITNITKEGKTREEIQLSAQEEFEKNNGKLVNNASSLYLSIQSGDTTSENIKDNEDFKKLQSQLDLLKKAYPELTSAALELEKTWNVGTQEYLEALEKIQDKLAGVQMKSLIQNTEETTRKLKDYIDKAGFDIELGINTTEFQNALNDLLNQNYEIDVAIHTEAEREFNDIVTAVNAIDAAAAKIGEDFIVTASDAYELSKVFPTILDSATQTAEGTIQLNQQVVDSAIATAQNEVALDADTTIKKLENQASLLRAKQTQYQAIADAAKILAKSEKLSSEDSATVQSQISAALTELEELNKQAVEVQSENSDVAIANSANENAKIVAENWRSAYQTAISDSAEFARVAAHNMQVAATGQGEAISKGDFKVNYTGSTGKSSEATELEEIQEMIDTSKIGKDYDEKWAEIAARYQQLADAAGSSAQDIENMMYGIGAELNESKYKLNNVRAGKGANPKESKTKDPDQMDLLDDEPDRYHQVDAQLDKINHQLEKIRSQEKKLIGKELIKNINAQLSKLDDEIDTTREKIKIAEGEASELRGKLENSGMGVQFNADGTIANYEDVYNRKLAQTNAIISAYNAMSAEEQEAYKEVVDQAKKDFEDFTSNLDRYDELVSDTIPGLVQNIQDDIDEEIELQIKKFDLEFEIRLDMTEAQKDWNEFKKRILDGIEDDDIIGNARARATDDLSVYLDQNGNGQLRSGVKQTNEVLEQLKQMDETGWSNVYGDDRTTALADLQKAYQDVEQSMLAIKDIQKDVNQAWLDTMDDINDKMADNVAMYEQINTLIEHDKKVIQLVFGENDYEALGRYYEQQHNNYLNLIEFQREQAKFWEEEMNSIADKNSEQWKKARDNWIAATNDLNKSIEESLQNIKDKLENAIDDVWDKYNKSITNGKGLDYVSQQWDLINRKSDQYLDTVNSAFGIRQLESKWQDAINSTDNVGAQRQLNELMNKQLSMLKEKDKLTQYDVDRANKEYEIALKRIALEEAQNTKTTMRLRRDSQGNYRYEYVADEDNIKKLQDELDALEVSLYNFDLDRFKSVQNDIVKTVQEMEDAIKDIEMDASLSYEEKEARKAEISGYYSDIIQGLTEQTTTAQENLYDSSSKEINKIWDQALKDELEARGKTMADVKELWDDGTAYEISKRKFGSEEVARLWGEAMGFTKQQTEDQTKDAIEKWATQGSKFEELSEDEKRIITEQMVPQFQSGVHDMVETFSGEGGFEESVKDSMDNISDATQAYKQDVEEIETAADVSFDAVEQGIDKNIPKTEELTGDTDELINSYKEELQQIKDINTALDEQIQKYKDLMDAAKNATTEAYNYWYEQNRQAEEAAAKEKETPNNTVASNPENSPSFEGPTTTTTTTQTTGSGNGTPEIGDLVHFKSGGKLSTESAKAATLTPIAKYKNGADLYIQEIKPGTSSPYHLGTSKNISDGRNTWVGWVDKDQISGYDTGGYTGSWAGQQGKLAYLHQKELVLNAKDTENLLDMVSIARSALSSLNGNLISQLGAFNATAGNFVSAAAAHQEELEQNVHIEANFPNVESAAQIEEALNNLVNLASMKAMRNRRG